MTSQKNTNTNKKNQQRNDKRFPCQTLFSSENSHQVLILSHCLNSTQVSKTSLNFWVKTDGFKVLPTSPFRQIYSDDDLRKTLRKSLKFS